MVWKGLIYCFENLKFHSWRVSVHPCHSSIVMVCPLCWFMVQINTTRIMIYLTRLKNYSNRECSWLTVWKSHIMLQLERCVEVAAFLPAVNLNPGYYHRRKNFSNCTGRCRQIVWPIMHVWKPSRSSFNVLCDSQCSYIKRSKLLRVILLLVWCYFWDWNFKICLGPLIYEFLKNFLCWKAVSRCRVAFGKRLQNNELFRPLENARPIWWMECPESLQDFPIIKFYNIDEPKNVI